MTANDEHPQAPPRPAGGHAAAYARQMSEGPWLPEEGEHQVGPEDARELMQYASVSYVAARLDGKRVARYATSMLEGTWEYTPDPLVVTDDGRLINGLNRLAAIVLSGTTQTLRIVHADEPTQIPEFHQGPRVCDVQPLPEDDPRRNAF